MDSQLSAGSGSGSGSLPEAQAAGLEEAHVEALVLAAYSSLLLGCLLRESCNTAVILSVLPRSSPGPMIRVLEAFVALQTHAGVLTLATLQPLLGVIAELQELLPVAEGGGGDHGSARHLVQGLLDQTRTPSVAGGGGAMGAQRSGGDGGSARALGNRAMPVSAYSGRAARVAAESNAIADDAADVTDTWLSPKPKAGYGSGKKHKIEEEDEEDDEEEEKEEEEDGGEEEEEEEAQEAETEVEPGGNGTQHLDKSPKSGSSARPLPCLAGFESKKKSCPFTRTGYEECEDDEENAQDEATPLLAPPADLLASTPSDDEAVPGDEGMDSPALFTARPRRSVAAAKPTQAEVDAKKGQKRKEQEAAAKAKQAEVDAKKKQKQLEAAVKAKSKQVDADAKKEQKRKEQEAAAKARQADAEAKQKEQEAAAKAKVKQVDADAKKKRGAPAPVPVPVPAPVAAPRASPSHAAKLRAPAPPAHQRSPASSAPSLFVVGDMVSVRQRTMPGFNFEGGLGRVTKVSVGSFALPGAVLQEQCHEPISYSRLPIILLHCRRSTTSTSLVFRRRR
jgi:hypothetical protein